MSVIIFDQTRYSKIAGVFLRKMVHLYISKLSRLNLIKVTRDGLNPDDLNLTYDLLFFALLRLEDLARLRTDDGRYLGVWAFARMQEGHASLTGPETALEFIATPNRTQFHGGLDSEMILSIAREIYRDHTPKTEW